MSTVSAHHHLPASSARSAPAPAAGPTVVDLACQRTLRGPYTAGGALLRRLVPELLPADPATVARHSLAIVSVAPDLAGSVPRPPQTLTNQAQGDEHTRKYSRERTRNLSFDVSELVGAWIEACHPNGLTLVFRGVEEADPTDEELIATLQRRFPAGTVRVAGAAVTPRDTRLPSARTVVDSDGTCCDEAALTAYHALDVEARQALHAERANRLIESGSPGAPLGAVPYHLERGPDPEGAGVDALLRAVIHSFNAGFYDATVDFAHRGRALSGARVRPDAHSVFTNRLISALMFLGRVDESEAAIDEQRRFTVDIADQMRCSYGLAMINTRYAANEDKDHLAALAWANEAVALADGQPDPSRRGFFRAFTRNAKALVVMHLGDLPGSLHLIDEAISVADESLAAGEHRLHRTVLVHNRARVLVAMRRYEEALASFAEVLARDPEYDEPYFDRALAHLAMGRSDLAHADLDRAIELGVAFLEARYNRANILLELGDAAAARRDVDVVLDINPEHLDGLRNRAVLNLEDGDLDAAMDDIGHALRQAPHDASLWSAKASVAAERGDLPQARAAYDRAIDLEPGLVDALAGRAILHFDSGVVTEAVADLTRALEIADSPLLRVNRGIALQSLGDHRSALADFDAALVMDGADVEEIGVLREQSLGELTRAASSTGADAGGVPS